MKALCKLGIAALVATHATLASAAEVGDPAAPLQVAEWLKGDPVDLAAVKGRKIVVVEFWATWCGPCIASIPHLTEMQRQFADRGVVFVGVSAEAANVAKPFVDKMGEKMDYTVAVDSNRQTTDGYLKAYGVNGIPHAFIVDRDGNIAWHGHPLSGLDKQLEKLAAAPVAADPAVQKRETATRKLREFTSLAASGGDEAALAALAAELTALDRELGGIEPGQTLDLQEVRRAARFQALMRDYQRAVAAGKPAAELAKLEEEATPLAPKDFKFENYRGSFNLQRAFQEYYRVVTGKGDAAQLAALTQRLELAESSDVDAQNEIAWTLLTDENIKTRNPKLALKFAQAAFDASGGKNPDVLDTYSRALFDNGDPAAAIKHLQLAIDLTTDPARRAELQEVLKIYQSGGASKR
jgi:thiol-disulfide isomerase/thioredoxin